MAERARGSGSRTTAPRVQSFGTAAVSARNAFAWFWSRESLLRLALSFVLSVALWLYITQKQDPGLAQDFPQPLTIVPVGLAPGLAETGASTVHVRYRVDTPGAIVTSINFHPLVNLAGMRAGDVKDLPVQVIPDPGLHVVQIKPSHVRVTIDRTETRTIRVRPSLLTGPQTGYTLGTIALNPTSIQVQGPHELTSQISSASVRIDLTGVTSTLINSYRPVLLNGQGSPISTTSKLQIDPPQVQVKVPITPLASLKTLPVLVPFTGQVKAGYRIVSVVTNPQTLTASGSPAMLSRVTNASTSAVRLTGHRTTFTVRVPVSLQRGLTSSASAAFVTVTIQPIRSK